jgi:outer membrane protein assembly factor BamD (BamD/ComL family)
MSVTGLSSGGFFSQIQQFHQEFSQLGQDLQSGNLSAAQSDFAALQSNGPQGNDASGLSQSSSPIAQAFSQLANDLQSGNLSAAQQDYSTIQSDFQNPSAQGHNHHYGDDGQSGSSSGAANKISQLFSALGSALQSGNLSSAQQAYSTLQRDLQQYSQGNSSQAMATQSGSTNFSVNG